MPAARGVPRPFLKWAGGKSQLLPELESRLPARFNDYHEPFVGGGALFFRLWSTGRLRRAHLSDANAELINVWRRIKTNLPEVIAALRTHEGGNDPETFYRVRAIDPAQLSAPARAARILYLNRTCFNGLYRENSRGRFNVPFGRYANPRILDEENLRAAARALRNATIRQDGFDAVQERARPGDLVYFDPPYHPLSSTSSFTDYSRGGFTQEDQAKLADLFTQLAGRGVHVVLSNSSAPFILKLYAKRGRIHRVRARRAINSKAERRGAVTELIITAP